MWTSTAAPAPPPISATSNFGGTIHFFSPELSDEAHVRLEETYGSWNTNQILGDINSGAFLHGKAHFWLNGDYQSSDGYQTFSPKQDDAATAKFDYKFSDRTYLSVIGTNIIVNAFTNNDPTRRQLLHYGDNYLYDNTETNSIYASTSKYYYDPQFWRFSVYHVASFFDIVSFNHDFGSELEAHDQDLQLRLLQPPALPEQDRPGSDHRLGSDYSEE